MYLNDPDRGIARQRKSIISQSQRKRFVVDRRSGIFNGGFRSVAAQQNTIGSKRHGPILHDSHLHGVWSRLASDTVNNSEDFGQGSSSRFSPRPACHSFRDEIEEGDFSQDVGTNDGVANAVERDLGAFLLNEQLWNGRTLSGTGSL
jgi:hypothetical protein